MPDQPTLATDPLAEIKEGVASVRVAPCPRDSDWCDGSMCARVGLPDCPNADPVDCALCHGHGDICNPGNADPERAITDWLPPVGCPRCGQTGKDPNP